MNGVGRKEYLILGSGAVWLARVFWAHEVAGSSPVFPTIYQKAEVALGTHKPVVVGALPTSGTRG